MFLPQPLPYSIILFILFYLFSIPVGAATFTVTNLNDSGVGSLRQAILNSSTSGNHEIVFQSGLRGTIFLTSGSLPEITVGAIFGDFIIIKSLSIKGPGASVLAISGNHASGIFSISQFGVSVFSGASIDGLTLRDSIGPAIINGALSTLVSNCIISANQGVGIYNANTGSLTANNRVVLTNNNQLVS